MKAIGHQWLALLSLKIKLYFFMLAKIHYTNFYRSKL